MSRLVMGECCYWRFKGEKEYRFGWPSRVAGTRGLIRMGYYNGDYDRGPVVDPAEIEVR